MLDKEKRTKKHPSNDSSLLRTPLKTVYLLNISTTYEIQTFIPYTCSQGWGGGGQDSLHGSLTPPFLQLTQGSDTFVNQAFLVLTWSKYIALKSEFVLEINSSYFLFTMHDLWLAKGTLKNLYSLQNLRYAFSMLS